MRIGLVGKPNVGKSTLFSAATLAKVDIANYPFCTIEPNVGVAFIEARKPCPCKDIRQRQESEGRLPPISEDDFGKGVYVSLEQVPVSLTADLYRVFWSILQGLSLGPVKAKEEVTRS